MFELYRLRRRLYKKYKTLIKQAMTHAAPKVTLVYQGLDEKQKIIDMINKYAEKYELCCHEYPSGLVTVSNQSSIRLVPMEVI